jgi:hypothetical protein
MMCAADSAAQPVAVFGGDYNCYNRCSGKARSTTMETHGLSREADSVFPLEPFGPWRACCRCWQAIGDPCGDDLDMHGGICNLGFVFERCLNCDGLCHFHGTWDGTGCRALPCQVGSPRKLDHLLSASVHLEADNEGHDAAHELGPSEAATVRLTISPAFGSGLVLSISFLNWCPSVGTKLGMVRE